MPLLSDFLREAKRAGVSLRDALRRAPENLRTTREMYNRARELSPEFVPDVSLPGILPSRAQMKANARRAYEDLKNAARRAVQ